MIDLLSSNFFSSASSADQVSTSSWTLFSTAALLMVLVEDPCIKIKLVFSLTLWKKKKKIFWFLCSTCFRVFLTGFVAVSWQEKIQWNITYGIITITLFFLKKIPFSEEQLLNLWNHKNSSSILHDIRSYMILLKATHLSSMNKYT